MLVPQATIVIDLGFGDSGKGSIIDYRARSSYKPTVVRFSGGAQAAHNVVTADGRHHTFAQFGSGLFAGARTHLSRFMAVDPLALMKEYEHLAMVGIHDALRRLTIDREATIVTPIHRAANRIREYLRGSGRHGSCGMGIGEAMADSMAFPQCIVRAGDVRKPHVVMEKCAFLQRVKYDEFRNELHRLDDPLIADDVRLIIDSTSSEMIATRFSHIAESLCIVEPQHLAVLALEGDLLLEGSQGVLLDEWHGFHPYTTWSTTTDAHARTLLDEIGYSGNVETVGVLRTYLTRHGAGPFPTEERMLSALFPEHHNATGAWQGNFRRGWFDLVMARYALSVSKVDSIALTHLDYLQNVSRPRVCVGYQTEPAVDPSIAILKSGMIAGLRPKRLREDLVHQERLTRLLADVRPVLTDAPQGDAFVRFIEKELHKPISIVSSGPTALDKRRPLVRAA